MRQPLIGQTLQQEGSYSTFTDENGFYEFSGVPVGEYTLIAAKDQTHQFARTNVMLGAVSQVDAQLTPTGSIEGQVQLNTTTGGENVSGAIVYLVGTSYVAVTDIDGSFTIANVPANQSFELDVSSSLGVSTTKPTVTVSPGTTTQAGIVTLQSPTVPTATIAGSVSVSGVTAPDPKLAGHLILLSANGNLEGINFTDENGNFSFLVKREGLFRVTPIPDEFDSTPIYQNVTTIFGETSNLQEPFVLDIDVEEPRYMVSGTIFKVEKAFPGEDESGVPIMLTSTVDSNINYVAVSAPDGAFAVDVASGEYQVSVGGGYRFQSPLTTNPIVVNASMEIPSPINLVPGKGMIQVNGSVHKLAFAFNETDQAGVPLTLTTTDATGESYAAVSDNTGNFTFYVPPGEYNLAVGGGYKFAAAFTANPLTIGPGFNFANTIDLLPTKEKLFKVSGTIEKTVFAFGETDHRDISVFLKDQGLVLDTLSTITDSAGDFAFYVPLGTYTLEIGGMYEFVTAPADAGVNADYSFGSIQVKPVSTVGGSVDGVVLPSSVNESYELRIESVPSGMYVDMENTDPGSGHYNFDMLPPGDYRILVLPQKNGYYAVSPQFSVTAGQHQTLPDINATLVKPTIDTAEVLAGDILKTSGTNFLSYPDNPADTYLLVDGIQMPRDGSFTLTDIEDRASIIDVAPGKHQAMLRKRFASGTVDVVLSSNLIEFTQPLKRPVNLVLDEVTDTSVSFSWENAPYAQQTEVEIFDPAVGTIVGSTDLVSGTRYEKTNLTASTSYEIRIRHKAGSLVSLNTVAPFSTKGSANYEIQQFDLDNSVPLGEIVGFEVLNDNIYIANIRSNDLFITRFDETGSFVAETNVVTFSATPLWPQEEISLTSGGNKLFISYFDSTISGVVVESYSPELVFAESNTFNNYSEGSLVYADGKLFFAGSGYFDTLNEYGVYSFENPDDLSASSTIEIRNANSLTNQAGYHVKATADLENNLLVYAIPFDSYTFQIKVIELNNTVAGTPFSVATISPGSTPDTICLRQIESANGTVYLRLASGMFTGPTWTDYTYLLDPTSGYVQEKIDPFGARGEFAQDLHGRVWMAEVNPFTTNNYFVSIAKDGSVEESLPVMDFISYTSSSTGNFPDPAKFIKLDTNTGSMNFLHIGFGETTSIYRYSGDY
jgi:hypothetical protein